MRSNVIAAARAAAAGGSDSHRGRSSIRARECRRRRGARRSGIWDPGSGIRQLPSQLSRRRVFHGRIPDWIGDVKARAGEGDLVVFVAGSHGRAERTVELLKDYDVRAIMASDAGDVVARRGDGGRRLAVEGFPARAHRGQARPQAGSRRSSSTPRPTSSTKNAARPAPARSDRCRPHSSPTFATSRSAI